MPKITFQDGSELDPVFLGCVFVVSTLAGFGCSLLANKVYAWSWQRKINADHEKTLNQG